MLYNHLKIAFRNFSKRKLYSIINVLGLSLSFIFCMLVFLYTNQEFGRDGFHANADNIYVVNQITYNVENAKVEGELFDLSDNSDIERSAYFPAMLGPVLKERIPEVKSYMRYGFGSVKIKMGSKDFEEKLKYVDSDFLSLFSFPVIAGDIERALDRPDKIAISKRLAEKYFGKENPIGQFLTTDKEDNPTFEVAAVFEVPANSSLLFDLLMRYEHNPYYISEKDNWNFNHTPLFLELNPGADIAAINTKLDEFINERYEQSVKWNRTRKKLSEDSPSMQYRLVALNDLYFNQQGRLDVSSRPVYSLMLIGVALVILIIACINYISISIATGASRSTEIGIRKTIGASRQQLRSQLFVEILLLTALAGLVSFTGTQIILPLFNGLTGVDIVLTTRQFWQLAFFTTVFVLTISLITNIYPSLFMARFKIMQSLSGRSTSQINPRFIQSLVVFQFVICIFFLSLSTTMHRQFQYINDKDLGYDSDGILVLKGTNGLTSKLRAELNASPYVNAVTGAIGIFSPNTYTGSLISEGVEYKPRAVFTDVDFLKTLQVELVSGRDFSEEFGEDMNAKSCLINEFYLEILKKDSTYKGEANGMKVIGVVKDFHFDNLLKDIDPIYFQVSSPDNHNELFINYDVARTSEVIALTKEAWEKVAPERALSYNTMNELLFEQYKQQRRWNKIINISSIAGVLIACIGLFGLTGIDAANRTKEIGIRKVLGANLRSILLILNRKTMTLILAAILIAIPVSYYVMQGWLDSFAYKTSVKADIFLISGGLCLLIVLLTSSYHSIKTAHINPSELLRDE